MKKPKTSKKCCIRKKDEEKSYTEKLIKNY